MHYCEDQKQNLVKNEIIIIFSITIFLSIVIGAVIEGEKKKKKEKVIQFRTIDL